MSCRPLRAFAALLLACVLSTFPIALNAQDKDAPPPRTISDITAVLEKEQPKPEVLEKIKATADAEPSKSTQRPPLATFYYERAFARTQVGRYADALLDAEQSVSIGRGTVELRRLIQFRIQHALIHRWVGRNRKALELFQGLARDTNQRGVKGFQIVVNRQITELLLKMGDLAQAETSSARGQALLTESRAWGSYPTRRHQWESQITRGRGSVLVAKGRYAEAAAMFARAEALALQSLKFKGDEDEPTPLTPQHHYIHTLITEQSQARARAGRLAEAEIDARRALIDHLQRHGKYSVWTHSFLRQLARVLLEQGRYDEADDLLRAAVEIEIGVGFRRDSSIYANTVAERVAVLSFKRRWSEAAALHAELEQGIESWPPLQRQRFELNSNRIYLMYKTDQVERGVAAARSLIEREQKRVGDGHFDTAVARGILAIGLMTAKQDDEALAQFRQAVPVLLSAPEEHDYDDTAWVAARSEKLQLIVEAYMVLLARVAPPGMDLAAETLPLADAARSQAVHKALAAASTRMVIKDPALAQLARNEQDLEKEINSTLTSLNDMLSLAPDQREEKVLKETRDRIEKLRVARRKVRDDLLKRFPKYGELLHPKTPGIAEMQAAMKPDEALLSLYVGRDVSFVWAVPKAGKASFAVVPLSAADIEDQVTALRRAVTTQITYVHDIPPFDIVSAHDLYKALLQPVEEGWRSAKTVFVVTNGALGMLPLGMLPTAPASVDLKTEVAFSDYRNVPWLARSHALVSLPSTGALTTLRSLPPGAASRSPMIGFGDPYFSSEQAAAATGTTEVAALSVPETSTVRGVPVKRRAMPETEGVDSADLALLPRLPDTADELQAVAKALGLDPATALKLGRAANEQIVKTSDLSRYRIVAFATHGLVAGELNGLTQPALALSAPDVAGVDGDGLLTMEEILALRLNADWVILSACNTGTGIGAGAEAASGLGRAFFYAGSRALLVTNWSVHSESARELVTDTFRRQAADPKLNRGEALRQAMMALMDGPGYQHNGAPLFSYAHPMFWAPYAVIGDGGAGVE